MNSSVPIASGQLLLKEKKNSRAKTIMWYRGEKLSVFPVFYFTLVPVFRMKLLIPSPGGEGVLDPPTLGMIMGEDGKVVDD